VSSDSFGQVKPSTGFGKNFVAPQKKNLQNSIEKSTNKFQQQKPQYSSSRIIINKAPKNKAAEEEKVKKIETKVKTSIENFNPFKTKANIDCNYSVGEKLVHKKFGIGIVKGIEEKAITIKFSEGEKKILLAIADKFLEKLN
jgi:DNA helicase-2/ATP-dependent DNA helicase PcrA